MPHLGCVAADEVVHRLRMREARDRRQHAECVAAEQDDVFGVGADAGDGGIVDVLNGVRRTRVLGDADVVIVHLHRHKT